MAYCSIVITGEVKTDEALTALVAAIAADKLHSTVIGPVSDEDDIRAFVVAAIESGDELKLTCERDDDPPCPTVETACMAAGLAYDLTVSIDEHYDNTLGSRVVWTPSMPTSVDFPWFTAGNPIVDADVMHRMISRQGHVEALNYLARVSNPRGGFPTKMTAAADVALKPLSPTI